MKVVLKPTAFRNWASAVHNGRPVTVAKFEVLTPAHGYLFHAYLYSDNTWWLSHEDHERVFRSRLSPSRVWNVSLRPGETLEEMADQVWAYLTDNCYDGSEPEPHGYVNQD